MLTLALALLPLFAPASRAEPTTPASASGPAGDPWVSPNAIAVARDGRTLFVASETSAQVLVVDVARRAVSRALDLPAAPTGLALSLDGTRLYVTCAGPSNSLVTLDWRTGSRIGSVPLGDGATSPVLSPGGDTVYVCHRFDDEVAVVDLARGAVTRRIHVEREPVAASLTPDGRLLFVGNHLPVGRADVDQVSAHVTVIDTDRGEVVRQLALPNGGNLIRDVRVSPDGRHACVTHTVARFQLPTTQVERGWMNANALTWIDVAGLRVLETTLLDDVERGAANPWGAAWDPLGRTLVITHAGTHEISVVDVPAVLERLNRLAAESPGKAAPPGYVVAETRADVASDLSFLVGLRRRISLPGEGPRAVAIDGTRAFVANYFSESVSIVELEALPPTAPVEVALHAARPKDIVRRGEACFNDARLCLEGWQSCASCHSSDARVDALNWDLMNDGKGNAKNTKSLLFSQLTAPAMSLGVRANAQVAVRAGIHHILFTRQPEEIPAAIDVWIASLRPLASPHLVGGQLSPAARRGKDLFLSEGTGCAVCHPPPLYTDRRGYRLGALSAAEVAASALDTPSLVEAWRTAPYLHDGSAATLRDVLVQRNAQDEHGRTSHLKPRDIDDLVAFLLSL